MSFDAELGKTDLGVKVVHDRSEITYCSYIHREKAVRKSLKLYINKIRILMAIYGNSHFLSRISFSYEFWKKVMQAVISFFPYQWIPKHLIKAHLCSKKYMLLHGMQHKLHR